MNPRQLLPLALWLTTLALLGGCATRGDIPWLGTPTGAEERRILVTFVDRSIGRGLSANPVDHYQTRGSYGNSSWSYRIAEDLAETHQLRLLAQWPVTVLGVACVVYEIPPDRSVGDVLRILSRDSRVASAQSMHTFRVLSDDSPRTLPYNDPYYRLQTDLHAMRIGMAHRLATGRGVRIAVIDTGIDTQHPDLVGQVPLSENLAPSPSAESTADSHGTAVAGVIAAHAGNGIGVVGIAPHAEIYALRACWPESPGAIAAVCNSFTLALALNEAIRLRAQVINLSLTGPEDPLIRQLVQKALELGIIVVGAVAGDAQGGFPANMAGVLAVRTARKAEPLGLSQGQIAAPGSEILTTLPHGRYDFMSGSSFAAPHVSGLVALLLELQPRLRRGEILAILDASRVAVTDACQALARLKGQRDCQGG